MAIRIPATTRRTLLAVATSALHELLKDESIDHSVFEIIEGSLIGLLNAAEKIEVQL